MEATLEAVKRSDRGKNEARRLRAAGSLPAVVYGARVGDAVPVATPVSVDPKTLMKIMHSDSGVNTLIKLKVEGVETSVLVKRFPPGDPLVANTFAMPIGAGVLLAVSLVVGETRAIPTHAETWLALAYLVIVATSIGFSLTLFVLSRWSASVAAYGFLLSPLVTIALGAILLDEHVTPAFLLGGALVLMGVYVGAFLRRPRLVIRSRRSSPSSSEPAG